jgi:hypothetical protein
LEREFVSFTFEGDPVEYKLCYDFNEIVNAEEVCGCNLLAAMGGGMSARAFRGLLYACLKTAHPQVLLSEAGDLMSRDREKVMKALGQVILSEEETAVTPADE